MHEVRSTAGLGRTILRSKFLQNFGVAFCDAEERFLPRLTALGDPVPSLGACAQKLQAAQRRRFEKGQMPSGHDRLQKSRGKEHGHECPPSFRAPTLAVQHQCQFWAGGPQAFVWFYAFSISSLNFRSTCAGMLSRTGFPERGIMTALGPVPLPRDGSY